MTGLPDRHAPAGVTFPRPTSRLLVGVGALTLLLVVALDVVVTGRAIAEEGRPELGPTGLARMALIAFGSASVIVGLTPPLLSGTNRGSAAATGRADRVNRMIALGGPVIAVGSALLLVGDPEWLNRLVVEDQAVEWLSAALCFVAAALFGAAARRYWRHRDAEPAGQPAATAVLLVLGAGVAAVLGFEEVSWFQRVLDIESPDAFLNRNRQGEINFHNFATGATGNGYYVAGFLALVALPFVGFGRILPERFSPIQPLIPRLTVLVAAAPAAAIAHEMWNIVWIQATFWMGLAAALIVAVRDHKHRAVAGAAVTAMVVTIVIYLGLGDTMVRSWDDTEVRELVIPYGLALYGYTLVQAAPRARNRRAK